MVFEYKGTRIQHHSCQARVSSTGCCLLLSFCCLLAASATVHGPRHELQSGGLCTWHPGPALCIDLLCLFLGFSTGTWRVMDLCGNYEYYLRCSHCLNASSLHFWSMVLLDYAGHTLRGFLLELLNWIGKPLSLSPCLEFNPPDLFHWLTHIYLSTFPMGQEDRILPLILSSFHVPLGCVPSFFLFPVWWLNFSQDRPSFLWSFEFTSFRSLEPATTFFSLSLSKNLSSYKMKVSFHHCCLWMCFGSQFWM